MSAPFISRSSSSDLEKDIEKTGDIEKEHEKEVKEEKAGAAPAPAAAAPAQEAGPAEPVSDGKLILAEEVEVSLERFSFLYSR